MNLHRTAVTLAVAVSCSFLASFPVRAQDSTAQSVAASQASLAASGVIVDGSAALIGAGSELTIAAVESVANASVIVLREAATGSQVSVRVGYDIARAASLAVGDTVTVVAEATGRSLVVAGKLIAFIPNEIGRSLLYQARSSQR